MDNPALAGKKIAAGKAIDYIHNGMTLGLGTGSTAYWAIQGIGERVKQGLTVHAIATSIQSEALARELDIPLLPFSEIDHLDITIDGADEVDPHLNLIKGGGGALLREKIVAQASRRVVITVDDSKLSPRLGTRHAVPLEVLAFGWQSQLRFLESLDASVSVRDNADGSRFVTDSGNMILDCHFGPIADPAGLADSLSRRAGIVEHGLFLGLATDLVVAGPAGLQHRTRR